LLAHDRIPRQLVVDLLDDGSGDLVLIDTVHEARTNGIGVFGYFDEGLHTQAFGEDSAGPEIARYFGSDPVPPSRETALWACIARMQARFPTIEPGKFEMAASGFDEFLQKWLHNTTHEKDNERVKDLQYLAVVMKPERADAAIEYELLTGRPDSEERFSLCTVLFDSNGGLRVNTGARGAEGDTVDPLYGLPPGLELGGIKNFLKAHAARPVPAP
jgi:hypothetical protein